MITTNELTDVIFHELPRICKSIDDDQHQLNEYSGMNPEDHGQPTFSSIRTMMLQDL